MISEKEQILHCASHGAQDTLDALLPLFLFPKLYFTILAKAFGIQMTKNNSGHQEIAFYVSVDEIM